MKNLCNGLLAVICVAGVLGFASPATAQSCDTVFEELYDHVTGANYFHNSGHYWEVSIERSASGVQETYASTLIETTTGPEETCLAYDFWTGEYYSYTCYEAVKDGGSVGWGLPDVPEIFHEVERYSTAGGSTDIDLLVKFPFDVNNRVLEPDTCSYDPNNYAPTYTITATDTSGVSYEFTYIQWFYQI